ncbi:hypothetical protein JCM11491_006272 [Sporobolomyces phaffii]
MTTYMGAAHPPSGPSWDDVNTTLNGIYKHDPGQGGSPDGRRVEALRCLLEVFWDALEIEERETIYQVSWSVLANLDDYLNKLRKADPGTN